jgi:hypothetical protein
MRFGTHDAASRRHGLEHEHRSSLQLIQITTGASLMLLAAGCKEEKTVPGDLGELGRVQFTYSRSCFFGCLLGQPLLVGTRETIRVTDAGNDPDISVRTRDEDVIELAVERQCHCKRKDTTGQLDIALDAMCEEPWYLSCENLIQVGALAAGETMLELYNERDQLLDQIPVIVAQADRARFFGTLPDALGEQDSDTFDVPAASRLELRVELYDEDGLELLAPEGVTWRVVDPEVATLSAFLIGAGDEVEAGRDIVVETLAPGETEVEIEVPGLTTSVTVEVSSD